MMTDNKQAIITLSNPQSELYFLVARFLENGPCKEAFAALKKELEKYELLPRRIDWQGRDHIADYAELVAQNRHIGGEHLLKICQRLTGYLNTDLPPIVGGIESFLGAGRQSMLRTQSSTVHHSHKLTGVATRTPSFAPLFYDNMTLLSRKLGHLAAVYCLMFDRTGKFIITGADDQLVKVWRVSDSRLMATLRGHASEISDITISHDNSLLAAGGCDKVVRVWSAQSCSPIAVLLSHTAMVTSVQFCPLVRENELFLLSTASDACVCFWLYDRKLQQFQLKPIKFVERSSAGAQMLCSSFSSGGNFLTTGSTDHVIRIYSFTGQLPEKVCELEKHTDRVDSIEYSNGEHSFVSGSHDGTANIWRYERQEWTATLLDMSLGTNRAKSPNEKAALHVTMVGWSLDNRHVITAASDLGIRVWAANSASLVHILQGHKDSVFVIDASPLDPRIIVSAGHDGNIILWDITRGTKIKTYFNMIEGQGHGAVFDCRFSPDGRTLAATDSHGFIFIIGFGVSDKYQKVPDELFFHTDYRPLIRDANNFVLDEQTQQPPHLMTPPFLVNMDGNPYPADVQRLVPGRENMARSQLVPRMVVNDDGDAEVIGDASLDEPDGIVADGDHPEAIDYLIENLQRAQDERIAAEGGHALPTPPTVSSPVVDPSNQNRGVGLRRTGEQEGVRQSLESMDQAPTSNNRIPSGTAPRVTIASLSQSLIRRLEERRRTYGELEWEHFVREGRRKPVVVEFDSSDSGQYMNTRHHRQALREKVRRSRDVLQESVRNRLTTRALYDTDVEEAESDVNEDEAPSHNGITHGSETEDYSDWMGDQDQVLEPPERTRRRCTRRTLPSSPSENDHDEEGDNVAENVVEPRPRRPRRVKKPRVKKKPKEDSPQASCAPVVVKADVIEAFRPPEWLTDVIPRKAPYMAQMGDNVVYFRQGHELYVRAVQNHRVYPITMNHQPWIKQHNLAAHEYVRVIGIKVEIGPPRLCCLKMAFMDPDSNKLTSGTFSIKYHDMADVIDFIVLKQNYDTATKRKWKPGDRFRSMIDDAWWKGTIISHEPLQPQFPHSLFQCFNVHWDNGEKEKLSPWDMEPIVDEGAEDGVRVRREELTLLMYTPLRSEWPRGDRDAECDRISHGLSRLMEHSIADEFLIPVDINEFPMYYRTIEYPMNLTTIKNRLDNRFYRRVTSIQYDVRFLERNVKTFNQPGSVIVRRGRILVDVILKLIKDIDCVDPLPTLNELCKGHVFRTKVESTSDPSDDEKPCTSQSSSRASRRKVSPKRDHHAWRKQCDKLVQTVWGCSDADPFRYPVDANAYPGYYNVIKKPMDLSTIRSKLDAGLYTSPIEMQEDFKLMFTNAKTFTPNKRSLIYTMTLRLSAMFEDKVKVIINQWTNQSNRPKRSTRPPSSRMVGTPSVTSTPQTPCSSGARLSMNEAYSSTSANSSSNSNGGSTDLDGFTNISTRPNLRKQSSSKSFMRLKSSSGAEGSYVTRSCTGARAVKRYRYSSEEDAARRKRPKHASSAGVNGSRGDGDGDTDDDLGESSNAVQPANHNKSNNARNSLRSSSETSSSDSSTEVETDSEYEAKSSQASMRTSRGARRNTSCVTRTTTDGATYATHRNTRNRGRQRVKYTEASLSDNGNNARESSEDEPVTDISSRGRVRRLGKRVLVSQEGESE